MKALRWIIHSSVARNMMICFLLVIIPTLALGQFSSYKGIQAAAHEITSSHENSLALLGDQLADRMSTLDQMAGAMLLDDDLMSIANQRGARIDLFDYVLFRNKMALYNMPNFLNCEMHIVLPQQNRTISIFSGVEKLDPESAATLQTIEQKTMWLVRPSIKDPAKSCLSVYRGFVRPKQTSPYCLLEISRAEMRNVLSTMVANTHIHSAFFIDGMNNIISTNDGENSELAEMVRAYAGSSSQDEPQSELISYRGRQYRLMLHQIGNYPCRIGLVLDESELFLPLENLRTIYIVFTIFVLLASALFIVALYMQMFAPLHAIVDGMRELENGNLSVRVNIKQHYNEFSFMTRQFNTTVEQLDNMIKESYLNQLQLKQAQLRYLRSQINPHFLYNSLFSLYNMIETGELDSASEMAIYLGKSYQRSAHMGANDVTLDDELSSIDVYLHIMSLRFPDRLKLSMDIQPEARKLKVPVLSIQTIVENAVLHGMEGTSQLCEVKLSAAIKDDRLHIAVDDTGKGMPPEQLSAIRERLRSISPLEDTHGIENVYLRLKLMYGDEISMTIENHLPHGTSVMMIIPLKKEADCNV
ncbi:MAG: sensor histidine kinase [Candidatus Fimadaptatus sp.]|jgi:two-component system sensor histidine kinase YesM